MGLARRISALLLCKRQVVAKSADALSTPGPPQTGRTQSAARRGSALIHPIPTKASDGAGAPSGLLTTSPLPGDDPGYAMRMQQQSESQVTHAKLRLTRTSGRGNPIRMLDMRDREHSFSRAHALGELQTPHTPTDACVTCPVCRHRFVPGELTPLAPMLPAPARRMSMARRGSGCDFGVVKAMHPLCNVAQAPGELASAQASMVAELDSAARDVPPEMSPRGATQVLRLGASRGMALHSGSVRSQLEDGSGGYAARVMASLRLHELRNARKVCSVENGASVLQHQ